MGNATEQRELRAEMVGGWQDEIESWGKQNVGEILCHVVLVCEHCGRVVEDFPVTWTEIWKVFVRARPGSVPYKDTPAVILQSRVFRGKKVSWQG